MKFWPFNKKSYAEVLNPNMNQLLKALFQYKIVAGIATPIEDTPDAYLTQGYSGNSDVYSIISRITMMMGQAYLGLYRIENGKRVEVSPEWPTLPCRWMISGRLQRFINFLSVTHFGINRLFSSE